MRKSYYQIATVSDQAGHMQPKLRTVLMYYEAEYSALLHL